MISRELLIKSTIPLSIMEISAPFPFSSILYGLSQFSFNYRGIEVVGHTGDLPGQTSILLGVPSRGVGVMLASNEDADAFGDEMNRIIANMVLDDLLGLEPTDWEETVLGKSLRQIPKSVEPPKDPRSSPREADVVGEYMGQGYGRFNLKLIDSPSAVPKPIQVTIDQLKPTGSVYVALFERLGTSHLVFTHFDGPLFNWTVLGLFPRLDGNGEKTDETVGYARKSGSAVFAEGGVGMFGGWWGQDVRVKPLDPVERGVKRSAEAWFQKM